MIKKLIKAIIPEKNRLNIRYAFFRFRSIFYVGNKVYCVCCDRNFRRFLPYGNIRRENAVCPSCHSLERTRLLFYYLRNETTIFENENSILHFAPERSIERKLKKLSHLHYITGDINPALADEKIDIQNINIGKDKFDFVICSHVLGHVPDEAKAIDEIYRVLKPGGKAFVLTLLDFNRATTYENKLITTSNERLKHYGEHDLLRLHGKDFINRLKRKNINVEQINYFNSFTEQERQRFQLGHGEREVIFKCEKL